MYEGIVHTKVQLLSRFNSGLIAIAEGSWTPPVEAKDDSRLPLTKLSDAFEKVSQLLYPSVCSQGERNPHGDLECFLQR